MGKTSSALLTVSLFLMSCVGMDKDKPEEQITETMPLNDVIELGIAKGDPIYKQSLTFVKRHQKFQEAHALATDMILTRTNSSEEMWRLVNLYQATSTKFVSPKVVEFLINAKDTFNKQLGWLLAANRPSDLVAVVIDRTLTRAILDGEEGSLYLPEMALAVQNNRIDSAYSILKRGLLQVGGAEFVNAMIAINPGLARNDFMDYLSMATIEDLRQMNQKTVDLNTCVAILSFLGEKGVPLEHPRFDHLFLYAVSRNAALSELASLVLEKYMANQKDQLAYSLARLPVWIQLAFVEQTKEKMNAVIGLFLTELKGVTAHREVVEEIAALHR